jgi:hypothetical protein
LAGAREHPHDRRAPTNPFSPEPVGHCDRCGFKYPMSQLSWQHDFRGNALANLKILVCPRDLDVPADQLRPVIITVIEGFVKDARPPNYEADAIGGPYGPRPPSGPGGPSFIDDGDILSGGGEPLTGGGEILTK